ASNIQGLKKPTRSTDNPYLSSVSSNFSYTSGEIWSSIVEPSKYIPCIKVEPRLERRSTSEMSTSGTTTSALSYAPSIESWNGYKSSVPICIVPCKSTVVPSFSSRHKWPPFPL